MKRFAAAVVIVGLVVGALLAPAYAGKKKAKKKERTVTATYLLPAVGSADATGTCVPECIRLQPAVGETYLSLTIEDASGQTPAVTVGQDTDPSNTTTERIGEVCGKTASPLVITPGVEIVLWVWATPSALNNCQGFGTTGEVTAVFSNLP